MVPRQVGLYRQPIVELSILCLSLARAIEQKKGGWVRKVSPALSYFILFSFRLLVVFVFRRTTAGFSLWVGGCLSFLFYFPPLCGFLKALLVGVLAGEG